MSTDTSTHAQAESEEVKVTPKSKKGRAKTRPAPARAVSMLVQLVLHEFERPSDLSKPGYEQECTLETLLDKALVSSAGSADNGYVWINGTIGGEIKSILLPINELNQCYAIVGTYVKEGDGIAALNQEDKPLKMRICNLTDATKPSVFNMIWFKLKSQWRGGILYHADKATKPSMIVDG